MYKRDKYISKIRKFINKPIIKVITGMRRVGKSVLLQQISKELHSMGGASASIVYINKESLEYDYIQTYLDLSKYIKEQYKKVKGKKYLLIDEIQNINQWEKAIASFFLEEIDIYITGSNAQLLSSEIATKLAGRYIEFPVYTLSFKEFLIFRNKRITTNEKEFAYYIKFGGLPVLHKFEFTELEVYQYVQSVYNTILLRDVIQKYNVRNVTLLENIIHFVFDNIGSTFSATKISRYLKSQHLHVGVETVQNYLRYLSDTFVINKIQRYDIKGKKILELHEKYFLGDVGIRHAVLRYREADVSGILENIVYLELKRRGYKVYIGKLQSLEVDFIAEKENKKIYIQIAYLLESEKTQKREFGVLEKIKDNYPKYVLSMDTIFGIDYFGIQRLNIIDFLLDEESLEKNSMSKVIS